MQYNEDRLLPIFLAHYAKYFAPENIFIIDHGSTIVQPWFSTNKGYNRIYVPRDKPFSEDARLKLIKHLAEGLLEYYDGGVYVDADELINLDQLDANTLQTSPAVYAAGFDVYFKHTPAGKRLFGLLSPYECKPLIFKAVPDWGFGFHNCEFAPALLTMPLVHLKFLFVGDAKARLNDRLTVLEAMSDAEKERGIDSHWKSGDVSLQKFYQLIDELERSKVPVVNFAAIDSSTLFKIKKPSMFRRATSQQRKHGRVKRTPYYHQCSDAYDLKQIYDLSAYFPDLLGQ